VDSPLVINKNNDKVTTQLQVANAEVNFIKENITKSTNDNRWTQAVYRVLPNVLDKK